MGYIPKPSNIAVDNSVLASDIAFIYDSMSSGTADINVYSIEADHLSLAENDAGIGFWGSIIKEHWQMLVEYEEQNNLVFWLVVCEMEHNISGYM